MSFTLDLEKFKTKVGVRTDAVLRRIAFDLSRMVILKTPVDTGRARANWIPMVGTLPTGTVGTLGKGKGAKSLNLSAMQSVISDFKVGQVYYLANNLPYIQRLEDGWSKQAPSGMVYLSMFQMMSKFEQVCSDAIREAQ